MLNVKNSALIAVAAAVAKVSAHGHVQGIDVDGSYYTGYLVDSYPYQSSPPAVIGWTEKATDNGFVASDSLQTPDIICHRSATNAKLTAPVAAGKKVRLDWNTWPSSHHGPVIDYLANCNGDCTTVDKTTLKFFKIDQLGQVDASSAPGTWATDNLIANNNSWTVTIPSTIAPGNYVLRHEIIALHSAGTSGQAQSYPQCINLQVTGGGSDNPAGTAGEALYKQDDAGILVNIYNAGLKYVIPGPALYTGGSGSGSGTGSVATSAAAAVKTSAAANGGASYATSAVGAAKIVPTTMATSVKATAAAAGSTQGSSPSYGGASSDTCEP